ncbi:23S rRNA pseudouridine(1911/1915/1917) synthase RluD [Salinisphaera orenii]|uniref:23S rRNA pseudouridine(1911/1915/1917) synthase RluD n=1 Tax=Salinisphaera orenii TaxID=856731 RepID=UPI000DBEA237
MPADYRERYYRRILDATAVGQRLDRALADCLPDFSRERLKRWLADGALTVDGAAAPAKSKVQGGEVVELCVPDDPHATEVGPEAIPLDVVYADSSILVINKPAGRVMHPGAGNASGTLQNALIYYDQQLACLPRSGIVHRLDKDTTGLCVVARTHAAHQELVAALAERRVKREYEAVARGTPVAGGRVDAPIGRHKTNRQRMAVTDRGRPAVTHYRCQARFRRHTHLCCSLESGRTHQIRVHLAHIGLPLVGDPTYGRGAQPTAGYGVDTAGLLREFPRQALHARWLAFNHPVSGQMLSFEAPRPTDLAELINALTNDGGSQ